MIHNMRRANEVSLTFDPKYSAFVHRGRQHSSGIALRTLRRIARNDSHMCVHVVELLSFRNELQHARDL
jgi:hypothetical protein